MATRQETAVFGGGQSEEQWPRCSCGRILLTGRSTTLASAGRRRFLSVDRRGGVVGLPAGSRPGSAAASPSASARTAMRTGNSFRSTGLDATHTSSRQWLRTTFRSSGCLVTRRYAPVPRASGMFSRFGSAPTRGVCTYRPLLSTGRAPRCSVVSGGSRWPVLAFPIGDASRHHRRPASPAAAARVRRDRCEVSSLGSAPGR